MRYSEITPRVLERAYWTYRGVGLVKSQTEFSQSILGRRPAYYSCMVSRGRLPSRRVLTQLRETTKTIMASFLGNPHFGKRYANRLNTAYGDLEALVRMLNDAMGLPRDEPKTAETLGCA
jgi:hypothetical protein